VRAGLQRRDGRCATPASAGEYHDQRLARLGGAGGLEHAALADRLPQLDGEPVTEIAIAGRASPRAEDRPWAVVATVSDTYFATMGMTMVAGRAFAGEDTPSREPVAIVNREMARRHWGSSSSSALDARISLVDKGGGTPLRVVGVVSDVLRGDREGVNPEVYVASRQRPGRRLALVVRAADP